MEEARLLEKEPPAMAEPPAKEAAADIDKNEEEEEKVGFLKPREREGLPRVQRMGPEGLFLNSFCISSKHFKNPFRLSVFTCCFALSSDQYKTKIEKGREAGIRNSNIYLWPDNGGF